MAPSSCVTSREAERGAPWRPSGSVRDAPAHLLRLVLNKRHGVSAPRSCPNRGRPGVILVAAHLARQLPNREARDEILADGLCERSCLAQNDEGRAGTRHG